MFICIQHKQLFCHPAFLDRTRQTLIFQDFFRKAVALENVQLLSEGFMQNTQGIVTT